MAELINMDERDLFNLTDKGIAGVEEEAAAFNEELVLSEIDYILRQAAR